MCKRYYTNIDNKEKLLKITIYINFNLLLYQVNILFVFNI